MSSLANSVTADVSATELSFHRPTSSGLRSVRDSDPAHAGVRSSALFARLREA
jgi:hypothetical protein